MPVDINALEEWTVGDRMLRDMLAACTPTRRGKPSGGAARCRPGRLGWRKATEIRDQAALLAECRPAIPRRRTGRHRRRHRPRLRPAADRHRFPCLGDRLVVGDVLQARRPAPASVVDSVAGVARSRSGPRLVGRLHRPPRSGEPRHGRRNSDAPQKPLSTCWPTWWRSTTRVGASRCRCRSRPRMRGRERTHGHGDPERPRGFRWRVRTIGIPARTPRRRTSGHGARAP